MGFPRRKNKDEVFNFFKKAGYVVTSGEYKNNKSMLCVVCPKNHVFTIRFNDFQQGHRCPECAGLKKVSDSAILEKLSEKNYTLTEPLKYKNNKSKISLKCFCGYTWKPSVSVVLKGHGCPKCGGSAPVDKDVVISAFSGCGYTLEIGTETFNPTASSRLYYICNLGHHEETTWNNFRNGCRCPTCSRKKKLTLSGVLEIAEKYGYKILSKVYVNANSPLEMRCQKNHAVKMSWGNFQQGHRCRFCSNKPVSSVSQRWLDCLCVPSEKREQTIRCFLNKYRVDAYDPDTNTVYEFFGDMWHGNPERFPEGRNPINKELYKDLYSRTLGRIKDIENCGYNLIYTWESDFLRSF